MIIITTSSGTITAITVSIFMYIMLSICTITINHTCALGNCCEPLASVTLSDVH